MISRPLTVIVGVAGAILLLLLPLLGSPTWVDLAFRTCSVIILAVSWNLMASAGLISLGHSGFFGVGGYVAILTANKLGASFAVTLLGAVLAGAILGASLALITGRLKGIYFAIATLAMSEGLRVAAVMLPGVTGGSRGAYLAPSVPANVTSINLAMSIAAVAVCVIAWLVSRSRFHFAFRAMRANESASQMLGIFPLKYRTGITAISGAMASAAGGIELWHGGYLDPAVAFDLHITIMAQIAPILGGIYTLSGPILGSVATIALGDFTRLVLGHIEGVSLLVFGGVLVVCVLYLPQGIHGALSRLGRKRNRPVADAAAAGASQ